MTVHRKISAVAASFNNECPKGFAVYTVLIFYKIENRDALMTIIVMSKFIQMCYIPPTQVHAHTHTSYM